MNLQNKNMHKVKVLLREGKASEEILKVSSKYKCNLIIIGSNGKTEIFSAPQARENFIPTWLKYLQNR